MNKLSQSERIILYFLGAFLIFMAALNLFYHIKIWKEWEEILWYCNFASVVCGIGILVQSPALVSSVLVTAIPSQFLWIVDFILASFGHGLGRTEVLFEFPRSVFLISIVLHVMLIPISFYATCKMGFSKKSIYYGLVLFIFLLLPLTYYVGEVEENRNCVFYPCDLDYHKDYRTIFSHNRYMTLSYLFWNVVGFWSIMAWVSYSLLLFMFNRTGKRVNPVRNNGRFTDADGGIKPPSAAKHLLKPPAGTDGISNGVN